MFLTIESNISFMTPFGETFYKCHKGKYVWTFLTIESNISFMIAF